MQSPPVLSAKRAPSSASQSSKRRRLDGENDPPFAVVIPLPSRRHTHSRVRQQITSNGRSTSSRPSPPSQRALECLRHILQLKRQISSSSSTGPSVVSPSPSCPLQVLKAPKPKKLQVQSPSNRGAESVADIVAAAINEGARLGQGGSGTTLRVCQSSL